MIGICSDLTSIPEAPSWVPEKLPMSKELRNTIPEKYLHVFMMLKFKISSALAMDQLVHPKFVLYSLKCKPS